CEKSTLPVVFLKFRVPVRHVGQREERQPLLIERPGSRRSAEEGRPARPDGMAQEPHVTLVGCASALLEITRHAGTDDVFPVRYPAPAARDHVIEVELGSRRLASAVLAGVAVAGAEVHLAEADA